MAKSKPIFLEEASLIKHTEAAEMPDTSETHQFKRRIVDSVIVASNEMKRSKRLLALLSLATVGLGSYFIKKARRS